MKIDNTLKHIAAQNFMCPYCLFVPNILLEVKLNTVGF